MAWLEDTENDKLRGRLHDSEQAILGLQAKIARLESYDREALAAVQHEIWAHWTRYQFSVCQHNEDGSITIPAEKVERWTRQANTPYSELSDKEQESDRHQADKVIAVLQGVTNEPTE